MVAAEAHRLTPQCFLREVGGDHARDSQQYYHLKTLRVGGKDAEAIGNGREPLKGMVREHD